MASTEQTQQLEYVFTAPASYPVDAITESQHCHLMTQWMNLKVKALLALFYLLNLAQPTTAGRFQKDMLG